MIKGEIYTDKINAAMKKAVNNGLKKACIMVEGQAVNLCPRDTGRLVGSITWKTQKEHGDTANREVGGDIKLNTSVGKNEAIIGTNVEYAPYLEYGVSFHKRKQPYLRPALDIRKNDIVKMFKAEFAEALK